MTGLSINLRRRQGDFVLDIAFSGTARAVALFGPSGSGKTTILKLIAGLLRPDSGRIVLGDRVVFDSAAGIDLPARHRRVGLVFQDGLLFPHMSVRQNLLYGAWARGLSNPALFGRTVDVLGIGALLDRAPRHLSGGERQRVAIGRALLSDPAILLMDEPVTAIDQHRRGEILPYLEQVTRETAMPLLYVSHDRAEVERLAQQIVFIRNGRVASGDPAAIPEL
jgi:molybdate transport system ATP-binding protein